MTNVPESVKAVAAGFSIPRPRVFVTARTLREDDNSLLPRDPVGRNKGTLLVPPHLTNLLFGVAAADPIASAPASVRAYREARYMVPLGEIFDGAKPSTPILGEGPLGPALDNLIDVLARPSELAREVRQAFTGSFRVKLIVGEALEAIVEDTATGRKCRYDAKNRHTIDGGQTFRFQGREWQVVPLQRVATLEFAHFELAAKLWADSLKHGAVYEPSLLDSSRDGPETENAGSPGREPAPSDCRLSALATSDDDTRTQANGLDNRASSLGVCVSSSGKSVRAGSATSNRRRQHALTPHHHAPA